VVTRLNLDSHKLDNNSNTNSKPITLTLTLSLTLTKTLTLTVALTGFDCPDFNYPDIAGEFYCPDFDCPDIIRIPFHFTAVP